MDRAANIRAIKAGKYRADQAATKKQVGKPREEPSPAPAPVKSYVKGTASTLGPQKRKPPVKKGKKPATRSKKMKAIIRALKSAYTLFLEERPLCRIKSQVCTGEATVVHHMKGRTPNVILNEAFWCEACPSCNLYVEEHPDWAMENGFKISKFDNRKK